MADSRRRKICIVSGTRADYGHLFWLLKEIQEDPALELQLVLTGMHLEAKYGSTWKTVERDGFQIQARVDMQLGDDSPAGVARSMGHALEGLGVVFERLKPDVLVVLGDRFEILCAAQAAMLARIPIAHIHGGELTEGLIDEAIRHSLTKMSALHYVAAEAYRTRVIQLGEDPARVMNFGAPGLDNIKRTKKLSRAELERELGFELGNKCLAITYHPVTLEAGGPARAMTELFKALDARPDFRLVFTKPNAEPSTHIIHEMLDEYVGRNKVRAIAAVSLGHQRYLSLLSHADLVLGNSSSGIIEAPALRKPTVNVGIRQQGRLRAASVIDCADDADAIGKAMARALSPEFQLTCAGVHSLYGDGNASLRIKEHLKSVALNDILIKRFQDLEVKP